MEMNWLVKNYFWKDKVEIDYVFELIILFFVKKKIVILVNVVLVDVVNIFFLKLEIILNVFVYVGSVYEWSV